MLIINFKKMSSPTSNGTMLFYSSEIDKELDMSSIVIKTRIKKQFEDTETTRNFIASSETGTTGMLIAISFTFIINLLMSGALGYMIGWINVL